MAHSPRAAVPVDTDRMPPGIPFIIGNEAAERFCFYGLRTILVVFMTQYLMRNGQLAVMAEEEAKGWFHLFVMTVYFLPFFGSILADALWGKYRTIMVLSLVYCLGSFMLALDNTRVGLVVGLTLIALGSGGIKPCVSANVGDQFGPRNQQMLSRVFNWFYFSINFGSFFSSLLTPWLLIHYGPRIAFGVPGIFMLVATVVFWLGRNRFVRVPPAGKDFLRVTFSKHSLLIVAGVLPIFFAEAIFWSLWDQTSSAWVLQAEKMDRTFLGVEWQASQVQAMNPILILLLIPVCTYWLYPFISRVFPLTPLRKIGLGLFLTVPTFLITARVETLVDRTSPAVVISDLSDPAGLVEKLRDTTHPMSTLLRERLSPEARAALITPATLAPALEMPPILAQELNRLMAGRLLYDTNTCRELKLSKDTLGRLERNPKDQELLWLNRTLLEESYPQELARRRGPTIYWHLLAFIIISLAEIMVSITCLEFAYTQAPKRLKSLIMSLNLMSIALGNAITAAVNFLIPALRKLFGPDTLQGSSYFLFFALLMLATAIAFVFIALRFKEQSPQAEE